MGEGTILEGNVVESRLNDMRIMGLPVQFVLVVVISLALTIYFGAWAADARVSDGRRRRRGRADSSLTSARLRAVLQAGDFPAGLGKAGAAILRLMAMRWKGRMGEDVFVRVSAALRGVREWGTVSVWAIRIAV